MTRPAANGPELRAALAAAPDGKLGRIVGMLDGLLDRSEADALLAPLRPRIAALRPPRPLRFARLLALPLEGALVAPEAWTGAPAEIPRSALTPLAEAARRALSEVAEEIEVAALGRSVADEALVGRLGRRLWPLAGAAALPPLPPGWEAAGLPPAAARPVLALSGALWRHGAALWELRLAGVPEQPLGTLLAALAPEGPAALTAAALLLLRHAAEPERIAASAATRRPEIAEAMRRALAAETLRRASQAPRG